MTVNKIKNCRYKRLKCKTFLRNQPFIMNAIKKILLIMMIFWKVSTFMIEKMISQKGFTFQPLISTIIQNWILFEYKICEALPILQNYKKKSFWPLEINPINYRNISNYFKSFYCHSIRGFTVFPIDVKLRHFFSTIWREMGFDYY